MLIIESPEYDPWPYYGLIMDGGWTHVQVQSRELRSFLQILIPKLEARKRVVGLRALGL